MTVGNLYNGGVIRGVAQPGSAHGRRQPAAGQAMCDQPENP